MAEIDFVLRRINRIDGAGAMGVVVALMRHLHCAAVLRVGGLALRGERDVYLSLWLNACRDSAGAAEVDTKRNGRTLFGDRRCGLHACDEGEGQQARHQRAIKTWGH